MLHLTVDAWRLQWLPSFPQLTSHTCNRPAGFTQEARGVSIGRDMILCTNMDLYCSVPTRGPIHACTPAVRRPGCDAKTPLDLGEPKLRVNGRMQWLRNTFSLSFRARIVLRLSLWGKQFYLVVFGRLACVMINSKWSPRPFLEMLQNKTEGNRAGRPVTGRVRDGDGETVLSEVSLWWALMQEGEKRRAYAAPASNSKSFFLPVAVFII